VRVLHVTPYFAPSFCYGGPPRSVLGLCRGLQRAGVETEVFATTANGSSDLPASPPSGERYEGVPVRYFPRVFPRTLFGAAGLAAALDSRLASYDVVHVHGLWNVPTWIAARHARRAGCPYVLSPRGMLDRASMARHARRKRVAYWLTERRNLAGATLLHATSPPEAQTLERYRLGVSIVTVPNGVDERNGEARERGDFRCRWGLGDAPLIAFLGRIHPIKRLDLLAKAFECVLAEQRGARLVLAGPDDGGHRQRLEPIFGEFGQAVRWVGELGEEEKWTLLTDADALVMCSDSESFGTSVVEALAAGLPVVVTQTCPWPEVQTVGCGFWVPQSADAIAAALLQILRDPVAARRMGASGRALVRDKYSWDSIGRTMADVYRAAVWRRPAGEHHRGSRMAQASASGEP
jgi:glycosyltransferase involved in cell wall biosynthesis